MLWELKLFSKEYQIHHLMFNFFIQFYLASLLQSQQVQHLLFLILYQNFLNYQNHRFIHNQRIFFYQKNLVFFAKIVINCYFLCFHLLLYLEQEVLLHYYLNFFMKNLTLFHFDFLNNFYVILSINLVSIIII